MPRKAKTGRHDPLMADFYGPTTFLGNEIVMEKITLQDRVLAYVTQNPGAWSRKVGDALGITPPHAVNILSRLERRGLLTSRPSYPSGANYRRKFYPADAAGEGRAIARRGQSFGGPFGVLAAQITKEEKTCKSA